MLTIACIAILFSIRRAIGRPAAVLPAPNFEHNHFSGRSLHRD